MKGGLIVIRINYRDSRPFYEQIKDNIIRLITTKVLRPDDQLPSVRELASELAINPNTIQRAYRELENEGYIYKISGRGTFISNAADIDSGKKKELFETLDKTVTELLYLSVSEEEITRHIYEMRNRNAGTAAPESREHPDDLSVDPKD